LTRLVPKIWLEKLAAQAQAEARENFWAFRRHMHPEMLWDWWPELVSIVLQHFYDDLVAGKRPKLALMAPPQHGKTTAAEDFIAWAAGRNPDFKIMYASYSNELGTTRNSNLQRMMMSERYRRVFPDTRIGVHDWTCNSELIEFAGRVGSFRNTTVDGQINGLEINLGVIDDPVKGRAEANSKTVRDRVWHWYTDDWSTRFAATSAELIIATRWHIDDLLGRLREKDPNVRRLRFPAIATSDEERRRAGEALFEELKPLEFLLERKRLLSQASWEAEYQQEPIVVGGGIFPIDKLQTLPFWDPREIKKSVRYWNKACTASSDAAFTAGVLMHEMKDGRFVIADVVRGQWSALDRERMIKTTSAADRARLGWGPYEIIVEQEPGSGGKESVEATIRGLAGFPVYADRVTGSKEVRAQPFAAQVQAGNVWLLAGTWQAAFLEELESFPSGKWKDQVDAAAGAFTRLTSKPFYNLAAMA